MSEITTTVATHAIAGKVRGIPTMLPTLDIIVKIPLWIIQGLAVKRYHKRNSHAI
jgi:hypothetical protein